MMLGGASSAEMTGETPGGSVGQSMTATAADSGNPFAQ